MSARGIRAAMVLSAAALGVSAVSQRGLLDQVRWLAGCWELKRGTRTTFEMWMPPDGGIMLGASRTTVDGALREWERVQLTVQGERLVYTALPSGQREAAFTSTVLSDSGFTVENPEHDFPQRIISRRRGADSLIARVEGPGPGGPRGVDFPMRRVTCVSR